jgi:lipopolysaccharide transport system ATP-binding protein
LRDVSFKVETGDATAIIGQNGAGKSTLLKILSRITEPTSGRIIVGGRVSSLLEVGTGFHGSLTGRENIQLNGAILGMTRKEIRERYDEIVAFAEVDRLIDTPVKYYSTGMYLRLAFAVAAHLEPEILVVDEVLAVGDAAFQAKCLRKMGDVASHGRTVLFVSHNMPAVKALCKTAVWLKEGKVVDRGPADQIIDRYLQHSFSDAGLDEVQAMIDSLPEDPVFQLRRITLTQSGARCTVVGNGEPLDVEIAFDVRKTTLGLYAYIVLYDLDETQIFESLQNGDCDRAPLMEAGSYIARVAIPANLLAPRQYQLRVNAAIVNVRRCIPDAVRINFDVQQTGIVNRAFPGYQTLGRLAPHLHWVVRRIEAQLVAEAPS